MPLPAQGTIGSGYGLRRNASGEQKFHYGIDILVESGTEVGAVASGVVIRADFANSSSDNGYGGLVIIDHGLNATEALRER